MPIWYRVFGRTAEEPDREAIRALCLRHPGTSVTFHEEEGTWLRAQFRVSEQELELERFLVEEEGIGAELRSWAAYLETCGHNPHHVSLMEHMIQTTQLFTLGCPEEAGEAVASLCVALSQHLATVTAGVYQVDGLGFFDAAGTLLVEER
jgi:hypothetical protein